jgi:hypothetical protein
MKILDEKIIKIYKETSATLKGSDRRIFQAKITNILNRMGYTLKRVQKTKPKKN